MGEIEKIVYDMANDESLSIQDMLNKASELPDLYFDNVYDRDQLIDIMCEHARNRDTFLQMAIDISDNPFCDYFLFDWSCWGNGCTPIKTKDDLASVLLDGSL